MRSKLRVIGIPSSVRVPTLHIVNTRSRDSRMIDEPDCRNVLLTQAFHLLARPARKIKLTYNLFEARDNFF